MAKPVHKRDMKRKHARVTHMPLGRQNFLIMGVGLLVILAGYLTMLTGSVEGFLPIVVAPILLVVGYCVLIPFGIIYRPSKKVDASGEHAAKGIAQ